MRRDLFQGKEVIRTEQGQCPDCRRGVVRVLVAEQGWRKWHAADIGFYGFAPHECGPRGDAPAKRAA